MFAPDQDPLSFEQLAFFVTSVRKELQRHPVELLREYLQKTGGDTSATGQVMRLLVTQSVNGQAAARRSSEKEQARQDRIVAEHLAKEYK